MDVIRGSVRTMVCWQPPMVSLVELIRTLNGTSHLFILMGDATPTPCRAHHCVSRNRKHSHTSIN